MRKHLLIPALLVVFAVSATQAFAQTATVVTYSGQRVRGQIVDMRNSGSLTVRVNGRDNRIPLSDVMMIDFMGNGTNIPPRELARANQTDGMVVLRNGRTLDGRLVDIPPSSNRAVLSGRSGQQNVALRQVARIYFGDSRSANQYGNPQNGNYGRNNGYNPNSNPNYNPNSNPNYNPNSNPNSNSNRNPNANQNSNENANPSRGNYGQGGNRGQSGQPGPSNINRSVTVPSNQLWTNSGINVQQGQVVHFDASGNISLSQNAGDTGTPAGANNGRLAGNSPIPHAKGGMLIGRVTNGQPFAIGAQSDVTMPASGPLSLGINDDYVQDNKGNFTVNIR